MYYNTLNFSGKRLDENINKCSSLQTTIKNIFEADRWRGFTRDEMYFYLQEIGRSAVLSSVGRALTDLKNEGYLHRSKELRRHKLGHAEQSVYYVQRVELEKKHLEKDSF